MIMENKVREKLEPKIREKSTYLRTFTFTKLYFGQKVSAALERSAWACCAASCWSASCPRPLRGSPNVKDPTGPQRGPTPPPNVPAGYTAFAPYPHTTVSPGSQKPGPGNRKDRGQVVPQFLSKIVKIGHVGSQTDTGYICTDTVLVFNSGVSWTNPDPDF